MPKFSRTIWNELHGLSAQEIEVIRRFESDARVTLFASAADILRKRGYIDEAIVIMEDGVKKYPQYHSARASLARDYYLKGMMQEAQYHMSIVVEKSVDNPMAQRLKLKLDLLSDNKDAVRARLAILKQLFADDDFTRTVRDLTSSEDWDGARTIVTSELKRLGIKWNDCPIENYSEIALQKLEYSANVTGNSNEQSAWEIPNNSSYDMLDYKRLVVENEETTITRVNADNDKYIGLQGFKRIQAPGFFGTSSPTDYSSLDSETLAEIYVTQGFITKALSVYAQMLKTNPQANHIEKRIVELQNHSSKVKLSPELSKKVKVLETLLSQITKKKSEATQHQ